MDIKNKNKKNKKNKKILRILIAFYFLGSIAFPHTYSISLVYNLSFT